MSKTTTSAMSVTVTPVAERSLKHLLYEGPIAPEDKLSNSLRGLRSLLLAALNTIDDETDEYILNGHDMRELLSLAFDLASNANQHAESWGDQEREASKELKKRADQLPESDELWVKCNVVADRQLDVVEKTAAIEGMIAQIKPVIITSYDGTKSIVEPYKLQVRKGWSGESVRDGWTPPVSVEEIEIAEEPA